MSQPETALLSIGALSQATGIPVPTLRSWEDRYGYPEPERLPSGHRRYTTDSVRRLRLIRSILDRGFPAGSVLPASDEELRAMVPDPADSRAVAASAESGSLIGRCLGHVMRFEEAALEQTMQLAWSTMGARAFILDLAVPYLRAVGDRWEEDDLAIRQEHCASEHMRDFLARVWHPLRERAGGPLVICGTWSGEEHTLGLQLAGVLLSLEGCRVTYLGGGLPIEELASAARETSVAAVLVGSSAAARPEDVSRCLRELRALLPASVELALGGATAQDVPAGATMLPDLEAVSSWGRQLRRSTAA